MAKTKDQPQFEFNVMMFGGKRTGKTSVLAAMKECFDNKFKNVGLTISPYDAQTIDLMKKKRSEMDGYFQRTEDYFECKDSPTLDKAKHSFKIQINDRTKGVIKLNFLDYPGEWVNSESHYKELAEEVKRAHVIIVAIDTPYLVEMPLPGDSNRIGKYNDKRNFPRKLAQLLKFNFMLGAEFPKKMVLFVPLKCEKYYHSLKMTVVNDLIISAYCEALQHLSGNNSQYCETVILPIITLGEVDFFSFKVKADGSIDLNQSGLPTTEMYKKRDTKAKKAVPIYCEQPAAYILMYLLDQAKESKRIKGNKVSKAIKRFFQWVQEFTGMPTAEEFIKIREEVLKVINDEGYIHTAINDPFNYNDDGGEV